MPLDPPGATRPADLAEDLAAAYAARGPSYEPRTHLKDPDGAALYVNRLIREASPYLVQHAHNPVDWRPWGEEAFAEARARDVPVFLSVGYATCHWCHVMEEESFDSEEVAAVLNARFVPVKLDREQRPDLDQIYITATQLQQGHAGWPNSVFLRPDGVPFHTGTYFPRPHFLRLLEAVSRAWAEQRAQIDEVAARLSEGIRRQTRMAQAGAEPPGAETAAACAAHLGRMHNAAHGGFSEQQQFPQETFLLFLLDRWRREGDEAALTMAARSLEAIAAGGIHDHAGGGFHRYTVDVNWRTPHFEKMLYNQGQLARAFVEGWEATGRFAWRRAAERCFAYVAREMTDAEGAFHAAEDADSPDASGRREEGAFYLWTPEEARAALGAEDGDWAVETLGLGKPVGEVGPVAHLEPGAEPDWARLDRVLERLREARAARARPIRDDKVIAGWNGLMIRALADGAAAFARPDLAETAARAADAVWARLWDDGDGAEGGRLWRLWAEGRALERGQLEDHAWFGLGCLALFEATGAARWRDRAKALAHTILRDFLGAEGRLRMAAEDGPLGPVYEMADGATPTGESSALELLGRVGAMAEPAIALAARELTAALSGALREMPVLRPEALMAARMIGEGQSGYRRLLADGHLALALRRAGPGWRLALRIDPGWHLNAADPGAADLVGAAAHGARVDWPEGASFRAGFAEAPIRVYDGALDLAVAPEAEVVALTLQLCSDRLCLAPVEARFRIAR